MTVAGQVPFGEATTDDQRYMASPWSQQRVALAELLLRNGCAGPRGGDSGGRWIQVGSSLCNGGAGAARLGSLASARGVAYKVTATDCSGWVSMLLLQYNHRLHRYGPRVAAAATTGQDPVCLYHDSHRLARRRRLLRLRCQRSRPRWRLPLATPVSRPVQGLAAEHRQGSADPCLFGQEQIHRVQRPCLV